jgi:hypothetical protein
MAQPRRRRCRDARAVQGDDPAQAALYASLAGFLAAQIGNAPGNYIPGAPDMVASAGIRLSEKTSWFAAALSLFRTAAAAVVGQF